LIGRLRDPATLAAARSDPFFYFVYAPEEAHDVRRRLPVWSATLRHDGQRVERVSFGDLLWELVDESGHWDALLAAEADFDQEQINESIRDVLRSANGLVEKVAAVVGREQPDTVVFLTETELLHPFFRVRVLESALHDRVKVPTVVFYPGRRAGQFGLHFLGFYTEDGNYRATLIGGLP
jgi:hypothetical protein